jgi:hypothetical protein
MDAAMRDRWTEARHAMEPYPAFTPPRARRQRPGEVSYVLVSERATSAA